MGERPRIAFVEVPFTNGAFLKAPYMEEGGTLTCSAQGVGRESILRRNERLVSVPAKHTFPWAKSIFVGHIQKETARAKGRPHSHRGQVRGHTSAGPWHAKGEAFRRAAASDLSFLQS